jgi:hypothetical protein
MSLFVPPSTPGVMLAKLHTLRPLDGSSTIARSLIVAETVARSVLSTCALDSTSTVSVSAPSCSVAFVRTTWLVATSTPLALNV